MSESPKFMFTEDKIITVSHAREYTPRGGCMPGFRAFVESHGFDWRDVVRNGILASKLVATGDTRAIGLVAWVYTNE
jgi:hypothetical protein